MHTVCRKSLKLTGVCGRSVFVVMALPVLSNRLRSVACLRTVILLFLVTFVWFQFHMSSDVVQYGVPDYNGTQPATELYMEPQELLTIRNKSHSYSVGSNMSDEVQQPTLELIKNTIKFENLEQNVLNEDLFGPVQNDTIVVVIQVHIRLLYLKYLILSLAQAKGIDKTLLIFSHDYYDEDINQLVQSIRFAKVMQIFYPFSIQTHTNEFPADSPNDCPREITIEQAKLRNCTNALTPDSYGHYREAKFTQIKHHWWWKANHVFSELEIVRNHSGLVLFLEEDYYLVPDFLHVLRLMDKTAQATCSECNVLSLGTYKRAYKYSMDSAKAEVIPWFNNLGLAFNRSVWQELSTCAHYFCTFDDYNWDWSLQHVSQTCLVHKLIAMVMIGPRVMHVGECGVHHTKDDCDTTSVIAKILRELLDAERYLYPKQLALTFNNAVNKPIIKKGNGGWGDVRDHELCMSMTIEATAVR